MTKKMAKSLSLLLAVIMVAALFAGCAGDKPEETTAASGTEATTAASGTEETTVAPTDLKGYVFEFGRPGNEYLQPHDRRTLGKKVSEELEEYYRNIEDTYHCTIKFVDVYNDNDHIIQSVMSETKHCDFVRLRHNKWIPLAVGNYIRPLDGEEMLAAGLDINDNECFYQHYTHLSDFVINGEMHTWGLDVSGKYDRFAFGHTYAFNKNLLANAGYKTEDVFKLVYDKKWTYDKFMEIAKAVTKDEDNDGEPEIWGVALDCSGSEAWTNGTGPVVFDETTKKWMANTTDTKFIKAIEFMASLYSEKVCPPKGVEGALSNGDRRTMFYSGKAGFAGLFGPQFGDDGKPNGTAHMDADNRPGLLPMPMGPDVNEYKMNFVDVDLFVMPTFKNWESGAFIMAKIADAVHDDEEYFEYLRWDALLGCEDSFKVLTEYLLPYGTVNMAKAGGNMSDHVINEIYNKVVIGESAIERGEAMEQTIQAELDSIFNQ